MIESKFYFYMWVSIRSKGKCKFTLEQATKIQSESTGIALLFL